MRHPNGGGLVKGGYVLNVRNCVFFFLTQTGLVHQHEPCYRPFSEGRDGTGERWPWRAWGGRQQFKCHHVTLCFCQRKVCCQCNACPVSPSPSLCAFFSPSFIRSFPLHFLASSHRVLCKAGLLEPLHRNADGGGKKVLLLECACPQGISVLIHLMIREASSIANCVLKHFHSS